MTLAVIFGDGAVPAAGVIFAPPNDDGAWIPPAGVGLLLPGAIPIGVPAIGVERRGTTLPGAGAWPDGPRGIGALGAVEGLVAGGAAMPMRVAAFPGLAGPAAACDGVPAGGVLRRGTIGGGPLEPVPINVLLFEATPRGGGTDPLEPTAVTGGGGFEPPGVPGTGGGRDTGPFGRGATLGDVVFEPSFVDASVV